MSKNVRYSITVDVPEGVNPVTFKSKIESLYSDMCEFPVDEECQFKNCFKLFHGAPCFVVDGAMIAVVRGDYIDWNYGTTLYRPFFISGWCSCSDDERECFLKALGKSGLKVSWEKDRGVFIQPKFKQGDLVSFGPRYLGSVEGWKDGMVTVAWYYDKRLGDLHEGYHQIADSTNARFLTDGEKELLVNKLFDLGYKIIDGQLKKLPFRVELDKVFYTVSFSRMGGLTVEERPELNNEACDRLWGNGNYFLTVDAAWDAARKVKELLLNLRE